ncbi:Imm6 family immunity protein [Virgibacillus sp. 6R]|uniref:Imm6 family immunity protein n=1 Tax=Metabacillus sp. 22489 TaxID=3453928 RepID=UPI002106708E
MRDIMETSINSRVAICLAYADETRKYLETEFNDSEYKEAFQKFKKMIEMGKEWLTGKKINWEDIYEMCNDDDVEYGCFNFIAIYSLEEKYEVPANLLIWTLYYFTYQCACEANERYFPQDLWDGHLPPEDEKLNIDNLSKEAKQYLSPDICEKLQLLEEKYRSE